MNNPTNAPKDQEIQELKKKYLHLRKLYCRISANLRHTEEELRTAHDELSLDIIEKNRGAEELVLALKNQNKQLIKLNAAKDKFISIMAHDLKSPFNSIIGFSRLLNEKIHAKDFTSAERFSEIILFSANNAMDLLKDLLEWALVKTGNTEFMPGPINFLEILNQVEPLFTEFAKQKEVAIFKNVPKALVFNADQEMIGVVLRNLISNAIKFTNKGGQVTISAEQLSGEIIVSVADTGIGIARNKMENLLRIEHLKISSTWKDDGTGLGLVLCKEFVEKHGGKLWVESKEGEGSVFYFSIPADSA